MDGDLGNRIPFFVCNFFQNFLCTSGSGISRIRIKGISEEHVGVPGGLNPLIAYGGILE